jgi:DNA-binding transcriptional LysR family regulator
MELRHLRYFIAVAEELHFGRAALRLQVAQPPLSRQIQDLEREVGAALLERTKRRVALTPAGHAFLERARRSLEQANLAVTAARRAARGQSGSLSVGFVGSATYGLLPQVLRRFRRQSPDVELVLVEMGSTAQQRAVAEGRLDLGLIRIPKDRAGLDPSLAELVLQREPLVICLPRNHPLAQSDPLPLAAMRDEPFILFPREERPSYSDLVLDACAKAGFAPTIAQQTQEMQTAVSLVAAGIGVTLVPDSVRTLRRDNVVYQTIAPPAPVSELSAIYRLGDDAPVLTAFLTLVRGLIAAPDLPATS